jgi:hypothetical protein
MQQMPYLPTEIGENARFNTKYETARHLDKE